MGILQKLLHFIGGKPPEVIFRDRQIFHDHPNQKWDAWKARFQKETHDWRRHSGKNWKEISSRK